MAQRWYERAYRRNVLDMHISALEPSFLTEFDPAAYVDLLVQAQVQAALVPTHSHVGLCLYPTRLAEMHPGLRGRDTFGEILERCHAAGIALVAYYSLIFDRWAFDRHPEWRIRAADGADADAGRHGLCCPNSPYRDYAAALTAETCERYACDGWRFDMTFWPRVCYCPWCRERYAAEQGADLPTVINWEDPAWVRFQRARERWLVDFAHLYTSTVQRLRPGVTAEHQSSTYPQGWHLGVTGRLAAESDFLQGDFYGTRLQGSFARKLFYNLSAHRPYAFETSLCTGLQDHTTLKSEELLRAKAYSCLADAGAFVFIDGLDPSGAMRPTGYQRMGRIFAATSAYEPFLGGELCQDVAVYLSTESKFDPADNGKRVDAPDLSSHQPHVEAAVSAVQSLIEGHLPYGVLTRRNLGELARHRLLVLPNVLMMDEEEAAAIRAWVRAGGCLYASRYSSLLTTLGVRQDDFLLGDVFGVRYQGETRERYTYLAPAAGYEPLFPDSTALHPAALAAPQLLVAAHPGAETWATLTLPYTDPTDPASFAAIHSNPPGRPTPHPALLFHRFGQGRALYASGDLESSDWHRATFRELLRRLAGSFTWEAQAPAGVEINAFHHPDQGRLRLNLVNFPAEFPLWPVEGVRLSVARQGRTPRRVVVLPAQTEIAYALTGDRLEFTAPRLEDFLMLAVDWA
jgi:hypothetical protein